MNFVAVSLKLKLFMESMTGKWSLPFTADSQGEVSYNIRGDDAKIEALKAISLYMEMCCLSFIQNTTVMGE